MILFRNLRAELIKMKGQPVGYAHIVIPVFVSMVFLAYYSYTTWSEWEKISAFYQLIGAGYPLLIGIFAANVAEEEKKAGGCQNLLTIRGKSFALISKLLFLLLLGLFAILLTSVLFGIGFEKICTNITFGMKIYVIIAFVIWCSSISQYVWHLFLAFQLGTGVSIGVGIVEGLISILFLTNLGEFAWKYVPCSWGGRIPYAYISGLCGQMESLTQLKSMLPIYSMVTGGSLLCYILWARQWEERDVANVTE